MPRRTRRPGVQLSAMALEIRLSDCPPSLCHGARLTRESLCLCVLQTIASSAARGAARGSLGTIEKL